MNKKIIKSNDIDWFQPMRIKNTKTTGVILYIGFKNGKELTIQLDKSLSKLLKETLLLKNNNVIEQRK